MKISTKEESVCQPNNEKQEKSQRKERVHTKKQKTTTIKKREKNMTGCNKN